MIQYKKPVKYRYKLYCGPISHDSYGRSLTPRVTLDCLKINTLFKSTPRAICKKSLNLAKNTSLLPEIPEINSVTFPLMIATRDTPTDETLNDVQSSACNRIQDNNDNTPNISNQAFLPFIWRGIW